MSALYAIGFVLAAIFGTALIIEAVTKAIAKPSSGGVDEGERET